MIEVHEKASSTLRTDEEACPAIVDLVPGHTVRYAPTADTNNGALVRPAIDAETHS